MCRCGQVECINFFNYRAKPTDPNVFKSEEIQAIAKKLDKSIAQVKFSNVLNGENYSDLRPQMKDDKQTSESLSQTN